VTRERPTYRTEQGTAQKIRRVSAYTVVEGPISVTSVRFLGGLIQGWPTFLRAGAPVVYKFRRNSFVCPCEFWRTK